MPDNADPKRPTFEERLEAIRQTLELSVAMHIDNDKEFRERFAQIAKLQEQVGGRISALVHIAELRQERLTHLEGDQQ